jgi:FixJ family two-component response regulator
MPHPAPIVFVVDADAAVRRSLETLIRREGWRPETFASAEEFLARPPEPAPAPAPACLVLEVALPGLGGLELQQRLAAEQRRLPIVFLTTEADVALAVRAVKGGAVEFFAKPLRDDALAPALRQAIDGSRAALEREAARQALLDAYASLSRREREVMALAASGLLNKQIGGELGISVITVKAHRGRVMRKMRAVSLAHLVRMAATLRLGPAQRRACARACAGA